MKEFEQKEQKVRAVKFDGTNAVQIASEFSGFVASPDGTLRDRNGAMLTAGQWVTEFSDGFSKIMTDTLFERMFKEVEPVKHSLADLPSIENIKIRRACWSGGAYIYWHDVVFMLHVEGDEKDSLYNMSIEDMQAEDWIIV